MALDVGDRRIGVAVSDPLGLLARGLTTIERKNTALAIEAIVALIAEWEPNVIVVGLPRNMDDSLGPQADKVLAFTRSLEKAIPLPIIMWDERLSTVSAAEILSQQGVRTQNQKQRIDAVAAAVILQEYLDSQAGPAMAPDQPLPEPGLSRGDQRASRRRKDRRRESGEH